MLAREENLPLSYVHHIEPTASLFPVFQVVAQAPEQPPQSNGEYSLLYRGYCKSSHMC